MKCNIVKDNLEANGVNVKVVRFQVHRRKENVPHQISPAEVVDGRIIKEEVIENKLEEINRMDYTVEITKGNKIVPFRGMQSIDCIWDGKTNPFTFAEADLKKRPEITLI